MYSFYVAVKYKNGVCMQLADLLDSLLSEKFLIKCFRHQNDQDQVFYQGNPKKSFDQLKAFYRNTEWSDYLDQFNTTAELSYCLVNNILTVPLCPYCGQRKKFLGPQGYSSTCCNRICHQKEVESTCWKKYGCKASSQNSEVQKRNEQTCLKRWGVPHAAQNLEIKEKTKSYFLATYKVDCPEKIPGSRSKRNKTWQTNKEKNISKQKKSILEKYGVTNISQMPSAHYKKSKRYEYAGELFDSKPELIYYLWCKGHDISIDRKPGYIIYKDASGKDHRYFPDFKIGDQYIEIKGDHLLDAENNLVPHPADVKILKENELNNLKDILKNKTKCIRENNVLLIRESEIKEKYEPYVAKKYGVSYAASFRKA